MKRLFVAALIFASAFFTQAFGQATAFTYQGKLNENGVPANGTYDLRFTIFDALANGDAVSISQTNPAVAVSNGLFTVQLDFGANAFNGEGRWLDIGVRTNGDANPHVVLTPRQEITSSPYAVRAANAVVANSANAVTASNIVGIISTTQLPASVMTNGAAEISLSGSFSGDGTGVTNVNLTTANSFGAVSYWTNYTLRQTASFFLAGSPYAIASGDFNLDGKLDLVVGTVSLGSLVLYTNNGRGGFAAAPIVSSGPSFTSVAAADLNGDGKTDIVAANPSDNKLALSYSSGSGFTNTSLTAELPFHVSTGDVNDDGKIDLVVCFESTNQVAVYTNTGSSFALASTMTNFSQPVMSTLADVNGDSKLDMIVANYSTNSLSVLTNTGGGTFLFSSSIVVGSGVWSVTASDFNNDGKMDLVSSSDGNLSVAVFTNSGNAAFTTAFSLNVGSGVYALTSGDMNNDGKIDVVAGLYDYSSLMILTNNGMGTLGAYSSNTVIGSPLSIVTADFNADGLTDVATTTDYINAVFAFTNSMSEPLGNFRGNFTGNASALTNLNATNLTGTIAFARLPSGLITNNQTGVTLSGTFSGNGNGLTLNSTNLTGTVPLAKLPSAVVTNNATGITLSGTFSGNGTGLSSLSASNLSGTLPAGNLGATGTYTPTIGNGTVNFITTAASGYYSKVGNLVYFEAFLVWTSKNSATTGNLSISLPFPIASTRAVFTVGYAGGITFNRQLVALGNGSGSTSLYDLSTTGGSAAAVPISNCAASGELQLSGWYRWQ